MGSPRGRPSYFLFSYFFSAVIWLVIAIGLWITGSNFVFVLVMLVVVVITGGVFYLDLLVKRRQRR